MGSRLSDDDDDYWHRREAEFIEERTAPGPVLVIMLILGLAFWCGLLLIIEKLLG